MKISSVNTRSMPFCREKKVLIFHQLLKYAVMNVLPIQLGQKLVPTLKGMDNNVLEPDDILCMLLVSVKCKGNNYKCQRNQD